MEKPRIIFSNYDALDNPYYGGGGARAIHEVAKRLVARYEVTVLTGTYPGAASQEIVDGVTYRRIGTTVLGPRLGQLIFAGLLPWLALTTGYDLWVESMTPPLGPSLLPLFTRRPVIALAHMLPGADMWRKYKIPFFWYERLALRAYHTFIALSSEMRDTIRKYNATATVHVIPNGVVFPEVMSESDPKHILFVGRIEVDQKGLDLLIEAYREVVKNTPYPLVIAGDGIRSEVEKLKALIAESGCADRITMVGRVDGPVKDRLFREAAAVVVPSRFESFGLVALEGLAYGRPVVTFDIEGFKWLPLELAEKAEPFRVTDFSQKNSRALAPGTAEVKKHRAEFVDRYRWGTIAQRYEGVLSETLQRSVRSHLGGPARDRQKAMRVFLEDIIKRRLPCFFISPHLDDAVLSAGGLLTYLADKTAVTVATVFTDAPAGTFTLSARQFLRQCGYAEADQLFADRRAEDRRILSSFGVRVVHFNFTDALWRCLPRPRLWRRVMGEIVPELLAVYPTFRFHVTRGAISREDADTVRAIRQSLRQLTREEKECVVFCPQAIGGHVDHVIVQRVCQEEFPGVVLWSDFPYNLREGTAPAKETWQWKQNLDRKRDLIAAYHTQVGAMFGGGAIPLTPEAYSRPSNE